MGRAVILSTEDRISMIREAHFDRVRIIFFLVKYVVNDEILLDFTCPIYISWYTLSNLTVRLTLSALGWLSHRF